MPMFSHCDVICWASVGPPLLNQLHKVQLYVWPISDRANMKHGTLLLLGQHWCVAKWKRLICQNLTVCNNAKHWQDVGLTLAWHWYTTDLTLVQDWHKIDTILAHDIGTMLVHNWYNIDWTLTQNYWHQHDGITTLTEHWRDINKGKTWHWQNFVMTWHWISTDLSQG